MRWATPAATDELAEIDPTKDQVVGRHPLPGCNGKHVLDIDGEHRLAFVALRRMQSLPYLT